MIQYKVVNMPLKLVSNQTSPNLKSADIIKTLPWLFLQKELDFSRVFNTPNYCLTNSGRSGLGIIIETINPPKTKKIAIPAFICGVVATPFTSRGYEIEWIDTKPDGTISVNDFEKKALKCSVVVVPHIFGQKAKIQAINKIAKRHKIFVIEDNAHIFNTKMENCDVKILSFGREKVYSTISGGAVLWPKNSPYANEFNSTKLPAPTFSWTIKHFLQPLILSPSLSFWFFGGKIIAYLANKTSLIPLAVTSKEKQGQEDFPITKLSSFQQKLLLNQINAESKIQWERNQKAIKWKNVLQKIFPKNEIIIPKNALRVIMIVKHPSAIIKKAKEIGFDLRDWDGEPIAPKGIQLEKLDYQKGMCPQAELFAQHHVTFPTNKQTTLKDIERFGKKFRMD